MASKQPRSSFSLGYVQPNGQSSQRLSPGFYSLSARSNVPFVRLIGKSVDKTFTWGEIVEVPENELCGVTNASFHGGDIFINGGCDYDNKPARITVPVQFTNNIGIGQWTPAYPADVRGARRAFVTFDATSDPVSSGVDISGRRIDGSHNTTNEVSIAPGTGYNDHYDFIASAFLGVIPLGHQCVLGDDTRPHILLTVAYVFVDNNVGLTVTPPNAYYTMEY